MATKPSTTPAIDDPLASFCVIIEGADMLEAGALTVAGSDAEVLPDGLAACFTFPVSAVGRVRSTGSALTDAVEDDLAAVLRGADVEAAGAPDLAPPFLAAALLEPALAAGFVGTPAVGAPEALLSSACPVVAWAPDFISIVIASPFWTCVVEPADPVRVEAETARSEDVLPPFSVVPDAWPVLADL